MNMPTTVEESSTSGKSDRQQELKAARQAAREYYGFGIAAVKRIKVCAECGVVCGAAESICAECGAKLPDRNLYEQSVEGKPRCKYCGTVITQEDQFCPYCGREQANDK